jgi:hypothetical protein
MVLLFLYPLPSLSFPLTCPNAGHSSHQLTESDTLQNSKSMYRLIRGIEREEKGGLTPLKSIWTTITYFPRQIYQGVQFASGYGIKLITNRKFIDTVEDFFFTADRRFGWYPTADITSSFRPRFGLNLLYADPSLEILLKGNYADNQKYQTETIFSYRYLKYTTIWRVTLMGLWEHDDDRQFYGFGANPESDPRSHFLPQAKANYGVYLQERKKIQVIAGFRIHPDWEYYITSYYQTRRLKNPSNVPHPMGSIFDLEKLPGFQNRIHQWYNELSIRFDTRDKNTYISGGCRIETYLGISRGLGNDKTRLLRIGFDLMGSIPIFQQNRILIPRLVVDVMKNLNHDAPIPFTEYPRQPSFRGVTMRTMVRTDHYTYVPSIEYQWPLSFNLSAHLFFDHLVVSRDFLRFQTQKVPWALGFGIDFHGIDQEIARIQIAIGNQGFRFFFTLGVDPLLKDRSNWY